MNKIYSLEDIYYVCKTFLDSPTDENQQLLNQLFDDMDILLYLKMSDKMTALYSVVSDADTELDDFSGIFSSRVELALFFNVALKYIVNLDKMTIVSDLKNYEVYDTLFQSGFGDYLLDYIQKDYNRSLKMFERTLTYENLKELINTMSLMDTQTVQDLTEELKQMTQNIDQTTIQNISDISRFNDPMIFRLKKDLEDMSVSKLDKIEQMDKLEKILKSTKEDLKS